MVTRIYKAARIAVSNKNIYKAARIAVRAESGALRAEAKTRLVHAANDLQLPKRHRSRRREQYRSRHKESVNDV